MISSNAVKLMKIDTVHQALLATRRQQGQQEPPDAFSQLLPSAHRQTSGPQQRETSRVQADAPQEEAGLEAPPDEREHEEELQPATDEHAIDAVAETIDAQASTAPPPPPTDTAAAHESTEPSTTASPQPMASAFAAALNASAQQYGDPQQPGKPEHAASPQPNPAPVPQAQAIPEQAKERAADPSAVHRLAESLKQQPQPIDLTAGDADPTITLPAPPETQATASPQPSTAEQAKPADPHAARVLPQQAPGQAHDQPSSHDQARHDERRGKHVQPQRVASSDVGHSSPQSQPEPQAASPEKPAPPAVNPLVEAAAQSTPPPPSREAAMNAESTAAATAGIIPAAAEAPLDTPAPVLAPVAHSGPRGEAATAPVTAAPQHPHAQQTPESDEPRIAEQALRGLRSIMNQRGGSVTLRLTPAELGEMRIRVDFTNNVVRASFEAIDERARSLLQQQMGTLRSALEAHGLRVEHLHVQNPAQSDLQQNFSQNQPHNQTAGDGRSRGSFDHGSSGSSSQQQEKREQRPDFERELLDLVA